MQTIEILRHEHCWVRQLLECLSELARWAEEAGRLDARLAAELFGLLEGFVDGEHQEKEERFLFPVLVVKSDAVQAAYVHRLFDDHRAERRDLAGLRAHALGAGFAEPLCVRELVERARSYAAAQHQHVVQEELVLFPLAERLLTPDEDRRIAADCDALAHGRPERRPQVRAVCRHLGVPTTAAG